MQHPTNDPTKALEIRLLGELGRLNRQISELEKDKISLERILVRIRKEDLSNREVNRKNSVGRLLVEKAILDRLRESKGERPVATGELWKAARRADPFLKEGTFRSYVHRMKARQEIEAPAYGHWKIAKDANSPSDGEIVRGELKA